MTSFILMTWYGKAQKQDFIWLYGSEPYDIVNPIRAADTTRGASNIDFNYDPPRFYYDPKRFLDFRSCNSSVCDVDGQILAYSNGMVIYNRYDRGIADTINYGPWWENFHEVWNGVSIPGGTGNIQEALILPHPSINDKYYIFYSEWASPDNGYYNIFRFRYSIFDVSKENSEGALVSKDALLVADSLSGSITAVRHGNGRDWWLIAPRRNGVEANVFLVDPSGIHFHSRYDTGMENTLPLGGIGQVYASPDGAWVSWNAGNFFTVVGARLVLSKFDRCAGILSDSDMKIVDLRYGMGMGVSFSPNSRYLYMCNSKYIYQYDLYAAQPLKAEKRVAEYDGYEYFFPEWPNEDGSPVKFCYLGLAPDGRIYVSPSSASTRMMSAIQYPDEGGIACEVRQHSVPMPTMISRGIPNFPPYRMGPVDGSACDTLGIDNHPIAKYRYEADTTDYLRLRFTDLSYYRPEVWSWDFGDGSPKVSMQHPYHSFATKGTYRVCLTVSNEHSSNTYCRNITLGTSSSDDTGRSRAEVTLFPNPASDYLLVTLGEYVPSMGMLELVDMQGRKVSKHRIYYGQNTVDIRHMAQGIYAWMLRDGDNIVKEGKIVKK